MEEKKGELTETKIDEPSLKKEIVIPITKGEDGEEYINNPLTKRPIKVNGAVYKKLVKANILKVDPKDLGRLLYVGEDESDAKEAKEKLVVGKNLKKVVKGKKVYSQARAIKPNEINLKIQEITLKVYEENKDKFNENMTREQIQTLIKDLVNQKLISNNDADINIKKDLEYLVENIPDEDDEEEDDEEEYDEEDDEGGTASPTSE
jgi:hypothetical protein